MSDTGYANVKLDNNIDVTAHSISEAQDILEKVVANLYDTTSMLSDRLDRVLRPNVPLPEKAGVRGTNASPESSQVQNRTWSVISSLEEIKARLQDMANRVDL